VIRSVFEDANNYMKSGTQLLAVLESDAVRAAIVAHQDLVLGLPYFSLVGKLRKNGDH
jgi:hypothetical protein